MNGKAEATARDFKYGTTHNVSQPDKVKCAG